MKPGLLAMILILAASSSTAETAAQACRREMHKRVAQVDEVMRQGYKVKEGERLKALHLQLEKIRANCDREPGGWKTAPRR